jgi:hypothetical protein
LPRARRVPRTGHDLAGRGGSVRAFAHGEWLASNVAGAAPRLLREEGHLSLLGSSYGEVLDGILEGGRAERL